MGKDEAPVEQPDVIASGFEDILEKPEVAREMVRTLSHVPPEMAIYATGANYKYFADYWRWKQDVSSVTQQRILDNLNKEVQDPLDKLGMMALNDGNRMTAGRMLGAGLGLGLAVYALKHFR